jgi:phosphotransferase system HPr-like phosphotransfer protein
LTHSSPNNHWSYPTWLFSPSKESELDVQIGRSGEEFAKANSALRLMALKIKTGETLTLSIDAPTEARATELAAAIQEFLKA